jgi:hypothetical protein
VTMLADIASIDWEHGVEAIVGEIADQDYRSLLDGAVRPMIFRDAHGYDVAEFVLGRILPFLAGPKALVVCHDMRDSRYFVGNRPPDLALRWRGQQEPYDRFLRLGDVHSSFEQLVSIVDFCSWSGVPFCSPTHEIMTNPEARSLFPVSGIGWPYCLWHYFTPPATS